MQDMGVSSAFNFVLHVPRLREPETKSVLAALRIFQPQEVTPHSRLHLAGTAVVAISAAYFTWSGIHSNNLIGLLCQPVAVISACCWMVRVL